tara:strand:+ start:146 stop:445 length:300 start_codon:yes stop_codon:yes gene_type:complete
MTIIISILLLVIICLLIFNLIRKEQFQIKCPPFSVRLSPENSHNSFSKGFCTSASFEGGEEYDYGNDDADAVVSDRCLSNQTYVKASNSHNSDSKSFCK